MKFILLKIITIHVTINDNKLKNQHRWSQNLWYKKCLCNLSKINVRVYSLDNEAN